MAPLLDAGLLARELLRFRSPQTLGAERGVAVLFAGLRDFTRLTEHRLPFDVVYLLNRYFRAIGEAVEAAGGRVDKFIGDGVMALFGASEANRPAEDLRDACRRGLDAARRMSLALEALNRGGAAAELGEPLRIGIGLHAGPAILGEMGHGRASGATAIGDTVNPSSRIRGFFEVTPVLEERFSPALVPIIGLLGGLKQTPSESSVRAPTLTRGRGP